MMILYKRKTANPLDEVVPVCGPNAIMRCIEAVKSVHLDPAIYKYIVDIVTLTRNNPLIALGASPRASIALMRASQSIAFMNGRSFVAPEDIVQMAPYVLSHRIHLTQEAKVKHTDVNIVINNILKSVKPPFRGSAQ